MIFSQNGGQIGLTFHLTKRGRNFIFKLFCYCGIIFILLISFFPIFWMLSTAFKRTEALFIMPPEWIPKKPTLNNFLEVWSRANFIRYYLNSIMVASATVFICLMAGGLAGYAFSRFQFKGSRSLMLFILTSQMFPGVLLLITIYLVFFRLRMLNTYSALVLAHTTFSLPFIIWMLKSFFDTIPKELEEAAYIDGCGRLKAFFEVTLPLTIPGIIGAAIYAFLVSWNDFLFALTLVNRDEMRTLPTGIALSFIGEFQYRWAEMMAASIGTTIPLVLVFIFLQKYLIRGLTAGAIKG